MNVFIKCPVCGKDNIIPEASTFTVINFTHEGSSGERKCLDCHATIVWHGEQLTTDKVEEKLVEKIVEKSSKKSEK